jgi:16S rRNA (guanine527-N7)-methyltransferase
MEPSWGVTAVDAVAKKVAFVRQAAAEAGIVNLSALHTRLEDMSTAELFDVVVSRAFGSLARLAKLTGHLLKPGGVWIAQKGQAPTDEVAQLGADLRMFHVEPVTVPGLAAARHLVWMRRVAP